MGMGRASPRNVTPGYGPGVGCGLSPFKGQVGYNVHFSFGKIALVNFSSLPTLPLHLCYVCCLF